MRFREQMRRVVWFLAALLLFAGVLTAQEQRPAVAGTPIIVVVPIEKTEVGLVLISATVAGRTGDFILDTGSEETLVDREFLGLKKDKGVLTNGVAMGAVPADVGDFCISSHCFGKTRVRTMNFDSISKNLGRHVDGMIGQSLLRHFDAVTIDYKHGTVILSAN